METSTQCVILVLLEMGLSFSGIVCNLLIVTTIRQHETLKGSTLNFLLLNLCFSNLLIAFLVKPISAIYVGYAISTGEYQVGLAFCTLYTFTYRTTWCVFPFTLTALCWCKLLAQFKCTLCIFLCCPNLKVDPSSGGGGDDDTVPAAEMALLVDNANHVDQPSPSPVPFTEIAMQFGSGAVRHGGSLLFQSMTRDSLSTPTPSTTTELCHQVSQGSGGKTAVMAADDVSPANVNSTQGSKGKQQQQVVHKRTIETGPTARQKLLVAFIWIGSAFFGVTTCFPDKVFGVEFSQKILEDQLRTIAPSPSLGTPRDVDLTYCTVKTGMNDMLDYIALMVALVIPLILGPCLAGILQALIFVCSRFLCRASPVRRQFEAAAMMAAGPACLQTTEEAQQQNNSFATSFRAIALRASKGPGWNIILGFTLAFVATYPIHMYVAEVYVDDNFTFLFVKYCLGFLFVLFVPIITLVIEKDIRGGIHSVFGSAVLCLQDLDMEGNDPVINGGEMQQ